VVHVGEAWASKSVVSRKEYLQALYLDALLRDNGLMYSRRQVHQVALNLAVPPAPGTPQGSATSPTLVVLSNVITSVTDDVSAERWILPMVKLEYGGKGYNTTPDDPLAETMLFDDFSKKERIWMFLALNLHPQAHVHVARINAFTGAVLAIEHYSLTSFSTNIWTPHDAECSSAWSVAMQTVRHVALSAAGRFSASMDAPAVLWKASGSRDVHLSSPSGATAVVKAPCTIEASAAAVAKREYLPPCSWPHINRIPFTYRPVSASVALPVLNRTESVRDAEAYRAHDVWSHDTVSYHVAPVGNTVVVKQQS
jgi:hypothetical protein